MFISGILDNMIAVVVVILILSLIVQSVQQGLKKVLKIKSRQLEESLLDLFETVLAKQRAAGRASAPILDLLPFRDTSLSRADEKVKALYTAITEEFKKLGRVAQSGKLMLDSIAKDDLVKVVRKVSPEALLAGGEFGAKLKNACETVTRIQTILTAIKPEILAGSTSAEFATLRDHLTPVINDLSALSTGGDVKPGLLVEHLLDLREIALADAFSLLGNLQDSVQKQAASAEGQNQTDLRLVSSSLNELASALSTLRQDTDAVLVPLRLKIDELEKWFDTVMHSFDERYGRGMKTWGLVVSFIVVLLMNANVFEIYHKITGSEETRTRILQMADSVQQRAKSSTAATASAAGAPAAEGADIKELQNSVNAVLENVDTFKSLQFQPLTRADLRSMWNNGLTTTNLKILLGWIIMTMLLSVGAPFWEDTLESLFGVKNLLRKQGDVKNVETQSGKGNPKT